MLEIMVVVFIMTILAIAAMPVYQAYVRRSRTSEALLNVGRMWSGALAYYHTEHATSAGHTLPPEFPASTAATPLEDASQRKYEPDPSLWVRATWLALNFSMSSPHYFQYTFARVLGTALEEPVEDGGPPWGPGGPFGFGGPFGPGGPFGSGGPFGGGPGGAEPPLAEGPFDGPGGPHGGPPAHGRDLSKDEGAEAENPVIGFIVMANGNQDGDEVFSFFYRVGLITDSGEVRGGPGIYQLRPLE